VPTIGAVLLLPIHLSCDIRGGAGARIREAKHQAVAANVDDCWWAKAQLSWPPRRAAADWRFQRWPCSRTDLS
jgi:hypothetical protein